MLLQVIQAGWLYQIEAPAGSCVEGVTGSTKLLVAEEMGEALTPRAVVRAAKDHVLGLSCLRSWPLTPGEIGGPG